MGVYPRLPSGSEVEEYKGVGGVIVKTFLVKGFVNISVLTSDREVGPTDTTVVITSGEDEVTLSDKLMDALKIVLLRPGEGIWRFADDGESFIAGLEAENEKLRRTMSEATKTLTAYVEKEREAAVKSILEKAKLCEEE